MADLPSVSPSVELIEFVRPYNNDVNLYVTNISKRIDKETVQVSVGAFAVLYLWVYFSKRSTYLFVQAVEKIWIIESLCVVAILLS